ncbi:hypothetical protein N9C22_03795 [Paracoccaceae bacterium]|nr:hypothetical protein [Paracoccaceae bacterium]
MKIGDVKDDMHSLRYNCPCNLALAGLDEKINGAFTGQTDQIVKRHTISIRQIAKAKAGNFCT